MAYWSYWDLENLLKEISIQGDMIYSCSFLAEVNYKEVIDDSLKGLLASLKCMVDVLINLMRPRRMEETMENISLFPHSKEALEGA
ncbi:hypothetical protein Y1Q_0015911 [Alligator mississippiensis]|uniref:Uncharacterized protein n=1 Tax=Alligator mississippiensis TaxID=8496 RepID=A0A151MHD8_ALLMI|nr:hypothetical protein Y1Q_0015911 [Alligator mississippiensis]